MRGRRGGGEGDVWEGEMWVRGRCVCVLMRVYGFVCGCIKSHQCMYLSTLHITNAFPPHHALIASPNPPHRRRRRAQGSRWWMQVLNQLNSKRGSSAGHSFMGNKHQTFKVCWGVVLLLGCCVVVGVLCCCWGVVYRWCWGIEYIGVGLLWGIGLST